MRIISGIKKSIIIKAPKNLPVRPTTDKVKESLFNIILNKFNFNEISVLDLFSVQVIFHMNSHPEGVPIYYQSIIIITVLDLSIKLLLNLN